MYQVQLLPNGASRQLQTLSGLTASVGVLVLTHGTLPACMPCLRQSPLHRMWVAATDKTEFSMREPALDGFQDLPGCA